MKKVSLVALAFVLLCGIALGEGDMSSIVQSHNLFVLDESTISQMGGDSDGAFVDDYIDATYCMLTVGGEGETSAILWKGTDGAHYMAVDMSAFSGLDAGPANLCAAFVELCGVEEYDLYVFGYGGETTAYASNDILAQLESIPDSDPITPCDSFDDFLESVSTVIQH